MLKRIINNLVLRRREDVVILDMEAGLSIWEEEQPKAWMPLW